MPADPHTRPTPPARRETRRACMPARHACATCTHEAVSPVGEQSADARRCRAIVVMNALLAAHGHLLVAML
jgi:hypothetical protein